MAKIVIETPCDAVNIFGVEELVKEMDIDEVIDCYSSDEVLGMYSDYTIGEYLNQRGFDFSDYVVEDEDKDNLTDIPKLNYLIEFCKEQNPYSCLTKDDMKQIINDYIDSLPNMCYNKFNQEGIEIDF